MPRELVRIETRRACGCLRVDVVSQQTAANREPGHVSDYPCPDCVADALGLPQAPREQLQ